MTTPQGNMMDPVLADHIKILSSFTTECFYILDVQQKQFSYISPYTKQLCGYSVEQILNMGYSFYSKIVHPEDLPLVENMYRELVLYCKKNEEKREEISYFSCTFRLQWQYDCKAKPVTYMVYHRVKPLWYEAGLCYLLCASGSTVLKESGYLRVYYKDNMKYEGYNFTAQRWEPGAIKPLNEREKVILVLARRGKSRKEIAEHLCIGYKTLQNQLTVIFAKLKVQTMLQAVVLASNHHLILDMEQAVPDSESLSGEAPLQRRRRLLTPDDLQYIQQALDQGQSILQTAMQVGVVESAIRYLIKQGKIHK
ncbi:MAG: LuxR C-terminal-related transcriptional regulator [Tannerella sp.]|jgi:DNA-binding CsgD family transcriptional regulator|nr:LuxR C-terminal-related transcriptional regulator [Tannerella sp.]